MEGAHQERVECAACPQVSGDADPLNPDLEEAETKVEWRRDNSLSTRYTSEGTDVSKPGLPNEHTGGMLPSLPPSLEHTNRTLPSLVPDIEAGPSDGWEVEVGKDPGGSGGWGWPELSCFVETKHGKQHLKQVVLDPKNWVAGVTVALVSVPLSISLGIASGTTPMRGVATAVFGGLCAGFFGSSDYNIVGPAGALSGMLTSYSVQWGDDVLPWLAMISAGICFLCAVLRLETYMLLMPKAVFEGFTVGVALIIGLNQVNFACGLAPAAKHPEFVANVMESFQALGESNPASVTVFLVQTASLWYLMRRLPKVPWTVIMPILSIPIGWLCDSGIVGVDLLTLRNKYGMLKPELVEELKVTNASFVDMLIPSFSIAIVAILETLISAKIASSRVDRPFNIRGEMRGLMISHLVCGAVGAMPPTGVFVRTSLNTSLGATHRFSQVLNAVVVAVICLALMPAFSYLPQATIAALLVVASIRMTPATYLRQLWSEDRGSLVLCVLTAAICVGADPVIGLAVGMAVALLLGARRTVTAPFVEIQSRAVSDGRAYRVILHGALTYINAEAFIDRARSLDDACEISLDIHGVRQLDHDGMCAIGKVVDVWSQGKHGCVVWLRGVTANMHPALERLPWFMVMEEQGRVQFT